MAHTACLAPLLLLSSLGRAQEQQAGTRSPDTRTEHATRAPSEDTLAPAVFEGFVLESDGAPAEGARVVSSAGGQAVADFAGYFRLEVDLPLGAESVQLTALGRGIRTRKASSSVALAGNPAGAWVGPLLLSSGSCAPGWQSVGGGMEEEVAALTVFDDGSGPALYAGGYFLAAGGVAASSIARWNGSSWSSLGSGMNDPAWVHALTAFDDGAGPALYAAGDFTTAGGVAANRIARWDGSNWSPLGSGIASPGFVLALCVFDEGGGPALYAAGDFTTAGGVAANRIARWNGSSWSAVGSGMGGGASGFRAVRDLLVFDDGSGPALYAAGGFTSAGGVAANRIARWNGTSWSAVGSGMDDQVHALAVFDDGSGPALYAGGSFTTAGGIAASRVARWNGSSWSALGSGMNAFASVQAMSVFDDGCGPALFAAGDFTTAGGVAANRIARWNGSSWSALGSGLDDYVSALASFDDGCGPALYVGGYFQSAGGNPANFLARWGQGDTVAPSLTCPPYLLVGDRVNSPPGEIVHFSVQASDTCSPTVVVCTPPSGSLFPRGRTLVTCTATDSAGNVSTCSFPVTVALGIR